MCVHDVVYCHYVPVYRKTSYIHVHEVRDDVHVHIFTIVCILISAVTPEKARLILATSLLDGCLPLSYLKGMSLGVPRSGKTLCMKHIFGIECGPKLLH